MGIFFGHSPFLADIVLRRRRGTSFIINLTKYRHREHLLLVAEGVQSISGTYFANLSFWILGQWKHNEKIHFFMRNLKLTGQGIIQQDLIQKTPFLDTKPIAMHFKMMLISWDQYLQNKKERDELRAAAARDHVVSKEEHPLLSNSYKKGPELEKVCRKLL